MGQTNLKNIAQRYWPVVIFFIALGFRAWNIGADLPNLYQADEPHHLNVAAHFGTGDLNPHDFKYPSLWKYTLAGLMGFLFLLGKITGHFHTPMDFASAFFHTPTFVYLSARLLAASFFSGGVVFHYILGRKQLGVATGTKISISLILSPSFFPYGRDATMNGIMIFFLCGGIYWLFKTSDEPIIKHTFLGGLFIGLATSTHYIAGPVGILIPVLYLLTPSSKRSLKIFTLGLIGLAIGFFGGTPYFILDYSKAFHDIFSMGQLHVADIGQFQDNTLAKRSTETFKQLLLIAKNLIFFLDQWGIGFALVLVGVVSGNSFKDRLKRALWLFPLIIMSLVLVRGYHGAFPRYSLGVYIPLLIPLAFGINTVWKKCADVKRLNWLFLATLFIPYAISTLLLNASLALADTRTQAASWIKENVAVEEKILISDPYNGPQVTMALSQIERLLQRTNRINHPRKYYYEALKHNHPGGGYTIYGWQRDLTQVEDLPDRTAKSYEAQDAIDLNSKGAKALLEEEIRYAVVNIDPNVIPPPTWINEIQKACTTVASFMPIPERLKGPNLTVFDCSQTKVE